MPSTKSILRPKHHGAKAASGILGLFLAQAALPRYFLCFIPQCMILASWAISSAVTRPGQRVFACWSGLYPTRLLAYRHFFFNSDVQLSLEPRKMERELHAMLSRVDVMTYPHDRNDNRLPPSVKQRLHRTFAPHPDYPRLVFERRPSGVVD